MLRPGGVCLVVTNSVTHLQELHDLLIASAAAVGIDRLPLRGGAHVRFKMEGGGR